MRARRETGIAPPDSEPAQGEATKEDLQRHMEETRQSISQTVREIRDTVDDQYASVKATVSGVLDWREGFQRDPILWSVGALSAGFVFGYTLGFAQKKRSRAGGKASALGTFAESLIHELRTTAGNLPLLSLDPHVRALFGFGLSDLLAEIGGAERLPRRSLPAKKKLASPRKAGRRRR